MKFAICDDEKIFRDEIENAVYDFFGKLELSCTAFTDGSELLSVMEKDPTAFDAVFLDIEMPQVDGMKAADRLRKCGFEGPIVFLTSHTELAMEGYEVSAFRFLGKPMKPDKMERTLLDLKEELWEKKRLLIRYEGEDVVLNIEDIVYVEAMNNSVSIVMTKGEYTVRKKLSDMENELSEITDCFARIHRGYLVNLSHVKKQSGNEVILTDGTALPISRGAVAEFKNKLFDYVRNSAR